MPDSAPKRRPPQAWLMILWLGCTLIVIAFALFSYVWAWRVPVKE